MIISLVVDETGSEGLEKIIRANKVAAYAAVCRTWQPHIEKFTFRHIVLTTSRLASSKMTSILSPERLQHVRLVHADIEIPHDEVSYKEDSLDWTSLENSSLEGDPLEDESLEDDALEEDDPEEDDPEEDAPEDDSREDDSREDDSREDESGVTSEDSASADPPNGSAIFTNAMRSLFFLLQRAPIQDEPYIALRLMAERPYSVGYGNFKIDPFEESEGVFAEQIPCIHLKLQLSDGEQLPELPMISVLSTITTSYSRVLDPASICSIASRMVRLEEIDLVLSDLEKRDNELRVRTRAGKHLLPVEARSSNWLLGATD